MSDTHGPPPPTDLALPRKLTTTVRGQPATAIPGPGHASFVARFGDAFPAPRMLESDLGSTAVYDLPARSGRRGAGGRRVLLVHGLNTPALGLLLLARRLQALDADAHVVLFDLWGHGLSSTPLVAHAPHAFHAQVLQVLGASGWASAHLVGYSFGGSVAVSFAAYHPWAAASAALVAPVGVMRLDGCGPRLRALLADSSSGGRDAEAEAAVLAFLEGGPAVAVPEDWRERAARGEVVAEALRAWELEEHAGYRRSVLSMFREDGNVSGGEDLYRRFARLPMRKVVVLAENDDVCSREQLAGLGLDDVEVVARADHGLVRAEAEEVARIVYGMWTRE